ncbi:MAG: hypothetical protein M1818_004162 [Claussenomyces sp. TS43310]|nr:MAG: hypothetical protein M1818_004162 [Claussenomyces sp. TS43310]
MSTRSYPQPEFAGYGRAIPNGNLESSRSYGYVDTRRLPDTSLYSPTSITYLPNPVTPTYSSPMQTSATRAEPLYVTSGYKVSGLNGSNAIGYGSYSSQSSGSRDTVGRRSPEKYVNGDYVPSPSPSDATPDGLNRGSGAPMENRSAQRRPSNRDEFDGPTQLLPRPPPEYIADQDRDLPHLPTNLVVQEQDSVLSRVNDRLSRCAFDFVAKYEFPIPIDPKMRPVERPEDREWTEWVYLLKRLATKRRIPARVLYQGQIKQLVTILENSLEMRHAAKHQSRPLKDDRNILQLISAGIQVAKILKDAEAMTYLDYLYVTTERQIQQRSLGVGSKSSYAVR